LSSQKPKQGYKFIKSLFGKYEEIPEKWDVVKFDELFESLSTGTNPRSDLEKTGDVYYIHYGDIHSKWNSILDCNSAEIPSIQKNKVNGIPYLKDGDLIIADASEDYEGSGTSILLKNVENKKIVSGLHTIALRTKNKKISSDFKTYLTSIRFVKNQIIGYVTGISVYGLSKRNLKKIIVLLPTLSEQQKITSILYNLDEFIIKYDEIITQTKRLRNGLMQKLLTKGIDHKKFKKTEIGEIPVAWNIVSIKDIAKIKGGKRLPKGEQYSKIQTKYPYLRIVDFKNGTVDTRNLEYLKTETYEKIKNYFISSSDTYITIVGSLLGLAGTIPEKLDGSILTENAAKLTQLNQITKEYLVLFLNSEIGQKQIGSYRGNAAKPKLALHRIGKIKIPQPTLEEQQKIVTVLSQIDSNISNLNFKKIYLKNLKKGLLQKLFTGQIRV